MHRHKSPIVGLIIALLCLSLAVAIIFFTSPNIFWEILIFCLLGFGAWVLSSWIIKNNKKSLLYVGLLLIALILQRLRLFNWLTAGLLLIGSGLISLIN